jgi:predicted 3-demethylubiquinone-9 3-methyltransferase (glyoxalase superfamily)
MQKINPFLWFNDQAEDAANFYVSLFKNSKVLNVSRYGEAGPGPKGTAMSVTFELAGQKFMALNGGPHFKFSEAISFFINCENQQEVDELWEKLSAGGEKSRCGWLKDKYGADGQDRHRSSEAGLRPTINRVVAGDSPATSDAAFKLCAPTSHILAEDCPNVGR